jgi:hypothetical protein
MVLVCIGGRRPGTSTELRTRRLRPQRRDPRLVWLAAAYGPLTRRTGEDDGVVNGLYLNDRRTYGELCFDHRVSELAPAMTTLWHCLE